MTGIVLPAVKEQGSVVTREDILKDVEFGIGYLPVKRLATLAGWSESTVRRYEKLGLIPKRTYISPQFKGWPMKDVLNIIANVGTG
nr:hypothetical protein [Endozoicomonas sp.]